LDKSKATSAKVALTAGSNLNNGEPITASAPPRTGMREHKQQKRVEADVRKAAAKARREKDSLVHSLEMRIAALEGQQKELVAALEDPAAYEPGGRAVAINRELSAVTDDLAQVTAEWETATAAVP
jgi:ATP-binding cassette subfamily F protein 3